MTGYCSCFTSSRSPYRTIATWSIYICFCIAVVLAPGCVERKLSIKSKPSGADLYVNGRHEGKTPQTLSFTHYGTRKIRLEKAGHGILETAWAIHTPAYLYFPLNAFFEFLFPLTILDKRERTFTIPSAEKSSREKVLRKARKLRKEAREKRNRDD